MFKTSTSATRCKPCLRPGQYVGLLHAIGWGEGSWELATPIKTTLLQWCFASSDPASWLASFKLFTFWIVLKLEKINTQTNESAIAWF